jgi:hypothetical protein
MNMYYDTAERRLSWSPLVHVEFYFIDPAFAHFISALVIVSAAVPFARLIVVYEYVLRRVEMPFVFNRALCCILYSYSTVCGLSCNARGDETMWGFSE